MRKERTVTAIVKEPGMAPEIMEIANELWNYQRIVGGFIECVPWDEDHVLIVNEEGKINGLEPNFRFRGDVIVGPAIWVGVDGDDFASIRQGLIDEVEDFTGWHRYDLDDNYPQDLEDQLTVLMGGEESEQDHD